MKKINSQEICDIALEAGNIVLDIYNSDDFGTSLKGDNSPLTKADLAANEYICNALRKSYPNIQIISEESKEVDYCVRQSWECYFIIDPIDGTKEFIKRNGEFTINIAYAENGKVKEGVVYAPVLKTLYYTENGQSFKRINDVVSKLPLDVKRSNYLMVTSRSHQNEETKKFIEQKKIDNDNLEIISIGSSLKLCLIAEGVADIYPRLGPTMEWDTAAAQAVVELAGGTVLSLDDNLPLRYNKENLLNPMFLVGR